MKINLNKIPTEGLFIDEDIHLDPILYENANILDICSLHATGNINYDYENNLVFDLEIKGEFLLEDSLTLEPIKYPFQCKIDEKVENIESSCRNFFEKSKNILDISEILWENIVLEVPISATNSDHKSITLHGEGWELKNENEKKIDPRLAKLTELLDEGKE